MCNNDLQWTKRVADVCSGWIRPGDEPVELGRRLRATGWRCGVAVAVLNSGKIKRIKFGVPEEEDDRRKNKRKILSGRNTHSCSVLPFFSIAKRRPDRYKNNHTKKLDESKKVYWKRPDKTKQN